MKVFLPLGLTVPISAADMFLKDNFRIGNDNVSNFKRKVDTMKIVKSLEDSCLLTKVACKEKLK